MSFISIRNFVRSFSYLLHLHHLLPLSLSLNKCLSHTWTILPLHPPPFHLPPPSLTPFLLLRSSTPTTTVTTHIHLLHNYNAIRDIGTGLLGLIAENRGVRVRDLYGSAAATEEGEGEGDVGEFGVREGD